MSKKEGSWSGMRKYLEQEMLAEEWKGRVRYHCTTCVNMDGCRLFEVYIDGQCFKRFSWETVNCYFIDMNYVEKQRPMDHIEYWDGFWRLMNEHPMETRTEYTDKEFCDALAAYRNSDIQTSIHSDNPIVLMFALFDRRVGKRTLEKLKAEMPDRPEWIQALYRMRVGIQ